MITLHPSCVYTCVCAFQTMSAFLPPSHASPLGPSSSFSAVAYLIPYFPGFPYPSIPAYLPQFFLPHLREGSTTHSFTPTLSLSLLNLFSSSLWPSHSNLYHAGAGYYVGVSKRACWATVRSALRISSVGELLSYLPISPDFLYKHSSVKKSLWTGSFSLRMSYTDNIIPFLSFAK